MATKTQSFRNHARWLPLYHFFASPITGLYALHTLWHFARNPSLPHFFETLYSFAIFAAVLSSRLMALAVQNRVIRLEMRLRLRELLPAELAARASNLRTKQLVALRFAGDAELQKLVERTLAGEFAKPRDIKRAVTDWQPDYLRA